MNRGAAAAHVAGDDLNGEQNFIVIKRANSTLTDYSQGALLCRFASPWLPLSGELSAARLTEG